MSTLYLVRHGQASLGSDNYDQLSNLGQRQSQRLGEYFARIGLRFDSVLTGTLKRHAQTLHGIAKGMGVSLEPTLRSTLNEYDSHAVIQSVYPHPLQKPNSPEQVQAYFRLLRDGLGQWMQGSIQPEGMPSYQDFEAGIVAVLSELCQTKHHNVLLVSSGGPISTAIGHVLAVPHQARIALNLQIRNSSVSEFHFSSKQHSLLSYNTLPHLDPLEHKSWITYA